MSPKTDTEVIIGGKVFTLSGYESEDYMQKIASYINGKITEYGKLDGFRRQPLDKQNILLQLGCPLLQPYLPNLHVPPPVFPS